MKFARIFLLFFQRVLQLRSISFIWAIVAFINPFSLVIFWVAVMKDSGQSLVGWSLPNLVSYYLLLSMAGSFLISHVERDVAVLDIQEGGLVRHLLKPMSYYWFYIFDEIPWRIIQFIFTSLIFLFILIFFNEFIAIKITLISLLFTLLMVVFGFFISFTFKMLVGFTAFWFTDFWGLQQIIDVIIIIFAGFVLPIDLFPSWLEKFSLLTPFPYIIYFPVLSFQGKLSLTHSIEVLIGQIVWLLILYILYKVAWNKGIKLFTGVGQ